MQQALRDVMRTAVKVSQNSDTGKHLMQGTLGDPLSHGKQKR